MTPTYHLFGMNFASDIPLPAPPLPQDRADVTIKYGQVPEALADPRIKGVRYQAGSGEFLLRVDRVARYYVRHGERITIAPENGADHGEILVFLMGSVMGALLHQRGILPLHAGAVMVNNGCVLFSGHTGIGKSTLSAGFQQRGYPFITDDLCAVSLNDGRPVVIPGTARIKLWADTLEKLGIDRKGLQRVRWNGEMKKYYLPVATRPREPVPLKAVFILNTVNSDQMEITRLKGMEKMERLIANTYRGHLLRGFGVKTDHFKHCAAVAAHAEVHRAIRPSKGFLLDEFMDLLEAHFPS